MLRLPLSMVAIVMVLAGCGGNNRGGDGGEPGDGGDGGRMDAARDGAAGDDAGPATDGGMPDECTGPEVCGNGLDDDCDGTVEEDCPCIPGETMPCFGGRSSARGLGLCTDGTMTCMDGLEFGTWGECEGDVVPL